MSITDERKKAADFSDSYYDIPSAWIGKTGSFSQITPAALKGKKIIVTRNTPRARYLADNYKESESCWLPKKLKSPWNSQRGAETSALALRSPLRRPF